VVADWELAVGDCGGVAADCEGLAVDCGVVAADGEVVPAVGVLACDATLFAAEVAVDTACPTGEDPVPDPA
jgi:hypothetical protein